MYLYIYRYFIYIYKDLLKFISISISISICGQIGNAVLFGEILGLYLSSIMGVGDTQFLDKPMCCYRFYSPAIAKGQPDPEDVQWFPSLGHR